ncbi:head-to-tail adaptor [Nocardia phage NS-I]|nr:head-to-tail adaptor [Nocardia phage NS-I]
MTYPPHGLTAEILAKYLPDGMIDPDTPNIQTAIDAAVGFLRDTANWHVFPAVTEVLTVDGEGGVVLTLPTLQVNSINTVTERGRELVEWTDYEWSATGDLKRLAGCWTTTWRGITVELNHGYALEVDGTINADLAALMAALGAAVATAAANPLGIPEVMGPFQWTGTGGSWVGDSATTLGRFTLPWSA